MTVRDILRVTTCDVYVHGKGEIYKFTGNWHNPMLDKEVKKVESKHQKGVGMNVLFVYTEDWTERRRG